MRPAVLIYNPASGRSSRRAMPEICRRLAAGGFVVDPRPTAAPGDGTRLARAAAAEGAEVVFALGGDGTLREAAAGILGTETVLGLLPAGTANVLARALGLPLDPQRAAGRLAGAETWEIDVGRIGGEIFLMMASAGLDAAVLGRQRAAWKKLLGRAAFLGPTLTQWWSYGYPEIALRADGAELRATFVAVCNIPLYGGDIRMAPDADCRDGRLDLVTFRGRGRRGALGFVRDLLRGRHLERDDVELRRVSELRIEGPDDIGVQIDGDVLAARRLPLEIGLRPERLRILVPGPT